MPEGRPPDFVIVGAQRAGTTSLFRYLAAHPDVAVPGEKELHFFDLGFARGGDWYRQQFPVDGVTGEATPYYLFHPHAPRRLAAALPVAKLIVLLRDPVERAVSHYKHEVATGFEPLAFEEAVAREEERLLGEAERLEADETYYSFAHQHWTYVARGRYAEQLERWFSLVARERVLVLRSEDLYADPAAALAETLAFLGLEPWTPSSFERYNATEAMELPTDLRRRLRASLADDTARLEALLGREMGWPA